VTDKALEHSEVLGITQWFLSYSDEQSYVVAQVIAQA
jgi:phosphopantetheinyl transferase (holo-ACP synthase)